MLEVAPGRLRVEVDGDSRWMKAAESLTREVQPGSYVVVYAGVAVEKVSPEEAQEQLKFLRDLEEMFPEDEA